MSHQFHTLQFTSLTPERWQSLPDIAVIKQQIASAALAHSEVSEVAFGLYSPPDEIREVHLTQAAADQILCMWHGHRQRSRDAPPVIPLKLFVCGFGQQEGRTWASIEIHPGTDNWEVSE
jgi:hypothetical protein